MKRTELFICAPLLIFSVILSCKTEPQHHDIPIAVWHGRQAVPVTRTELQYAHQAGFTICILEQDNQRFNENALALADSLGLQLILSDEKLKRFTLGLDTTFYAVDSITKSYKRHRSFMGPLLFDKPGLDDFPGIIDLIDYFAVKHSDLTPFIQALPGYASPARLDTSNYNDYLALKNVACVGGSWLVPADAVKNKEIILDTLKKYFRPEFLNRIDNTIIFNPLTQENLKKIVEIQIEDLRKRLNKQHLTLKISEKALDYLAKKGYDPDFGARPLKRLIQQEIENPLAVKIIEGSAKNGDTVKVDLVNGNLQVK